MEVLREYYKGALLVHAEVHAKARSSEEVDAQGDGTSILGVLEVAESDIAKGLSSPVQKAVELLEDCNAKVQKDLDAEGKAMEVYTTSCDDTMKDKAYAIKTAESGNDVQQARWLTKEKAYWSAVSRLTTPRKTKSTQLVEDWKLVCKLKLDPPFSMMCRKIL